MEPNFVPDAALSNDEYARVERAVAATETISPADLDILLGEVRFQRNEREFRFRRNERARILAIVRGVLGDDHMGSYLDSIEQQVEASQ